MRSVVLLATLLTTSCATIVDGTMQSVAIDTEPAGATCQIFRYGEILGSIISTPGSARVDKSKRDLTIACSKPGYQTASISQTPHVSQTTFLGNAWAGGFIGVGIDAASGANYEYPDLIHLSLAPATVASRPAPMPPWAVAPEPDMR